MPGRGRERETSNGSRARAEGVAPAPVGTSSSLTPRAAAAATFVALVCALLAPRAAEAADPYLVSRRPVAYKSLPIAGGGDAIPFALSYRYNGYAEARLPFPVNFFGTSYTQAAVSTSGYLTFGPVATATDPNAPNYVLDRWNFEIPSYQRNPSRLIAPWWGDLSCMGQGTVKSQILGSAPHRQYVIEWRACFPYDSYGGTKGSVNMQIWFTEGSDVIETRYGSITEGGGDGIYSMSVGIMNPRSNEGSEGNAGLSCTPRCGLLDWPTNTAILYSQEADAEVEATRAEASGHAGVSTRLSAVVRNLGYRPATGLEVKFYVSRKAQLDPDAIEIGVAPQTAELAKDREATFELEAKLPRELETGLHYILAEANPSRSVVETTYLNNVLASAPIEILDPAPDPAVGPIASEPVVEPGADLGLSWLGINLGNAAGLRIPYSIYLTSSQVVSVSDRVLASGVFDVDAFGEIELPEAVRIPEGIRPGAYRIGVIIDPASVFEEIDKSNNSGVSAPVLVGLPSLAVATAALPPAELGAPWCMRLDAAGGDGRYVWSVAAGSALPPGVELIELPAEAQGKGGSFQTLLCGRPQLVGSFDFELRLVSGGESLIHTFTLEVADTGQALSITSGELPLALFMNPYAAALGAVGGVAPYEWQLAGGALPAGLELRRDGSIVGAPVREGSYSILVRLTDAAGTFVEKKLGLLVPPPARLTCVTRALPTLELGSPVEQVLEGAGGRAPYRFSSRSTRRLARAIGDVPALLGEGPPPGLSLSRGGAISGSPGEAGVYLWTVELTDAGGSLDLCTIEVEVAAERGLTVITAGLKAAVAGEPYLARLEASGGSGELRWRLLPGSRLPAGLELQEGGLIEGSPELEQLQGLASREFSFVVEVRDGAQRRGLAPIAITLYARPIPEPDDEGTQREEKKGGCQGAGGQPTLLALGLALAAAAVRRRARS